MAAVLNLTKTIGYNRMKGKTRIKSILRYQNPENPMVDTVVVNGVVVSPDANPELYGEAMRRTFRNPNMKLTDRLYMRWKKAENAYFSYRSSLLRGVIVKSTFEGESNSFIFWIPWWKKRYISKWLYEVAAGQGKLIRDKELSIVRELNIRADIRLVLSLLLIFLVYLSKLNQI